MRLSLIAVIIAVACAAGPVAQAQDETTQVRQLLAERVVDVLMRENLVKVIGDVTGQILSEDASIPDDQAAWMRSAMPEMMNRHLGAVLDGMEDLYAARFTAAELQALIDFYDTPTGQTIARKQNEVSALLGAEEEVFLQAFGAELMTKYCAEFDCENSPATTSQRSKG